MTDATGYNGWTNYETWNVSLWLDNEQGTYYAVREETQEWVDRINEDDEFTVADAKCELADWLKSFVEDLAEQTCPGVIEGASFVADMFGAALSNVDWYEIAANHVNEMVSELSQS